MNKDYQSQTQANLKPTVKTPPPPPQSCRMLKKITFFFSKKAGILLERVRDSQKQILKKLSAMEDKPKL
uniref:Uncharacterized protein n=1 Tax=Rhizophora mucronata TaxID=61149 RepID=A0A2P2IPX5_RHIMU